MGSSVSRAAQISPRRARHFLWFLPGFVFLAPVIWCAAAGAYVRGRSDGFSPFFWSDPRQELEVASPPAGLGISADELRAAAVAATQTWSFPTIACTGVSLRIEPGFTDSQVAGRDGKNRIIMRTGEWCRDPAAPTDALKHCHDPSIVALTTLFTRARLGAPDDGQILEADIEINAVGTYRWAIIPDGPISGRDYAELYDLVSVLTHETGHFIGLDHTCLVPGAPSRVDDKGVEYPGCFSLPANQQMLIQDATMYPFTNPVEVKLRTLTPDDARAACEIYPPVLDEWAGGAGCTTVPARMPREPRRLIATAVFASAATVFLWVARRRRAAAKPRNSVR
jgi:hypothetical protein